MRDLIGQTDQNKRNHPELQNVVVNYTNYINLV